MTNYREILRLKSLGFSERNIALSCSVSRNTVSRVVQAASKRNISWPLDFDMTDKVLEEMLFPSGKTVTDRRLAELQLYPQRTAAERRLQETSVDRVSGGMPPVRRIAPHVFSVL